MQKKWDQLFGDATSRGQIEFFTLLIGVLGDDYEMDMITVSPCLMLKDGTAETTSDSIFAQVCSVK